MFQKPARKQGLREMQYLMRGISEFPELKLMAMKVIAAVDDLFFASKIRGTAEQLGVSVDFPRGPEALIESARHDKPSLIICDLHSSRIDPLELARALKAEEQLRSIPLLGFFSHVQTELQRQALDAGFDVVIPRSAFTRDLNDILAGHQS